LSIKKYQQKYTMGLIGIIENLNISSTAFFWVAVISAIIGIVFLLEVFNSESSFLTKILYGGLTLVAAVFVVGFTRGYFTKKQIEALEQQLGISS
jgi:uncharacterized membrane protein